MSIAKGILDELDKQYAFSVEEEKRKDRILDVLIPQLKGDKIKRAQVDKIAESAVKFYSMRTTGLEEDERKALLNIVQQNPAKALSVYTEVIEAEKRQGQARIVDNRLINFYDLVDVTKPENITREEWVRKAATMATDPDINTYDDMMMKLMDPDLSLSEIKNLSREYTPYVTPAADPTPDFDYSAINVLEPAYVSSVRENIITDAIDLAEANRDRLNDLIRNNPDDPKASGEDVNGDNIIDGQWAKALSEVEKILARSETGLLKDEGAVLRSEFGVKSFRDYLPKDNRIAQDSTFQNIYRGIIFDADGNLI